MMALFSLNGERLVGVRFLAGQERRVVHRIGRTIDERARLAAAVRVGLARALHGREFFTADEARQVHIAIGPVLRHISLAQLSLGLGLRSFAMFNPHSAGEAVLLEAAHAEPGHFE
ncbi:MAG: hypothetical protein O3B21_15910 [Proteobacteria bacterium]|nr:hypothetical protein [Pseudomonadota bacterium]